MSSDANARRLRLIGQILELPEERLAEVEQFLQGVPKKTSPKDQAAGLSSMQRDWPHAPLHRISEAGTYMVTASTYEKAHHFRGEDRLDYLEVKLLSAANTAGWQLEAWAVFSNHYHFIGHCGAHSEPLSHWIAQLHRQTGTHVNRLDQLTDRQVWFNYWDKQLSYENSYLARLNYVHYNPVKHGLAAVANQYRWCSAAWFERTATPAQIRTIYSFKIDRLNIPDDFEPV
jgi:putative transposase